MLNRRNVVGFSGTRGNGAMPSGFGAPAGGRDDQLLAWELAFSAQIEF
jgi:hypothetical protein